MKALPIGKSDFKKLMEEDCYYVDKTQVIEELFESKAEIVLFPRPRRFGKSLLMSMLYNFFEIDLKEENEYLFKNLYISKSSYYNELSKYPTIFLNFKDLKSNTFESAYSMFKSRIGSLYGSKSYVSSVVNEEEREMYDRIKSSKGTIDDYKDSIKLLSTLLERYYNEKVIILIDEYDAAINEGYIQGYYDDIINLLQPVLSSALKDNTSLKMGILTGVLRVGGASLFSSFNNVDIYDVMSNRYNEYFGFTEGETKELLNSYDLELTDEVKNYYDGYKFSGLHIYNPWSILNYANRKVLNSYWMNTGSNKLLKDLLSKVEEKDAIEKLIQGESIPFRYDSSITYETLTEPNNLNNLLNLFLVSGYVTFDTEEEGLYGVKNYFKIPNKEVREDLTNIVSSITFKDSLFTFSKYEDFISAFFNGDKEYIEEFINNILPSMSYNDYYETFYHGYSLGLFSILLNNKNFIVKSNREAGSGRLDIMLERTDRSVGVVIEFKVSEEDNMEETAEIAVKQMREKEYYKELILDKVNDIREIVIVYNNKKCIVR